VLHQSAFDFTSKCLELLCAPPFSLTTKEARAKAEQAFSHSHMRMTVLKTHPATESTPATALLGPTAGEEKAGLTWLPQDAVLTLASRDFDAADVAASA
jgi:hypothetical protein